MTTSSSSKSKSAFHVFSRTTTGYKKVLRGNPCEDAVQVVRLRKAVICAVADGHGDAKCKYANIGAALAVETACDTLRSVYENNSKLTNLYEYCANNRENIEKEIIAKWNERVLLDFLDKPESESVLQDKEELLTYVEDMFNPPDKVMSIDETREYYAKRDRLADTQHKITFLYGTTLNAVIVTEKFVLCLSIGDGDIVAVQGKRIDWLIPASEQFSTKTDSLCFRPHKALEAFKSIIIRKSKRNRGLLSTGINPDFIIIATDGFRNSFLSDDHFADKIIGINVEKKQQYNRFQRSSQKWIEQLTKDSLFRDDITFGFIYK